MSALRTKGLGKSVLVLDECLSTNTLGLKLAESGAPHGLTIIAEKQTQGRGRHGRPWLSPEGGIWMSIILRPRSSATLGAIPMISALAVVHAVNAIHQIRTCVRWPNDVVFNGRKLAGSLVENRLAGDTPLYSVVGLGVNANFPSSLLPETGNSTTISESIGHSIEIVELVASILLKFEHFYENVETGRNNMVLDLLKRSDFSKGKKLLIELENTRLRCIFQDHLTLTTVLILDDQNSPREIETSSAAFVEYLDA